MKKGLIIIIVLILLAIVGVFICLNQNIRNIETYEYQYNTYDESGNIITNTLTFSESKKMTNYVKIDTSKGVIFAELYPNVAPKTVANFKNLVKQGFYTDLTFHRVIKDFMIQTGDPTGTGNGGSNVTIKGEFSSNGIENNLSHKRGVLSMARAKNKDSASSQFFIVQKDYPSLDGNYAAFGNVIAGLEVVDKIATVMTDSNDKPIATVKLNSITFVNIK